MQAGPGQKQRAGGPWNQKDKWKACHKPTTRGPVLSARGSQARGITKQHTRAKGADDRQVGQLSPSLAQGARQPVCQCLVLLLPSHSPQAAPLEAAPRKGRPRPPRVPAQLEAARARPAGSRNFLWPGATPPTPLVCRRREVMTKPCAQAQEVQGGAKRATPCSERVDQQQLHQL